MASTNDPIGANDKGANKSGMRAVMRSALANRAAADTLLADLGTLNVQAAFLGTSTSTTTDWGMVLPGDVITTVNPTGPAVNVETVTTAGTKPSAGVIGALYMVLRPVVITAPAHDL